VNRTIAHALTISLSKSSAHVARNTTRLRVDRAEGVRVDLTSTVGMGSARVAVNCTIAHALTSSLSKSSAHVARNTTRLRVDRAEGVRVDLTSTVGMGSARVAVHDRSLQEIQKATHEVRHKLHTEAAMQTKTAAKQMKQETARNIQFKKSRGKTPIMKI
jgi:hypothetical protein